MERVGFIGLGLMGQPMARNLQRAGFPLTVFARNMSRATALVDAGASLAMSARGVAETSDIIFINVSDDAAVEDVLFAKEGVAAGMRAGSIVVDMGTTSPTATRDFAAILHSQGVSLLDAPVSGGEIGAINGTLSIMAGGTEAAFQRVLPCFQAMGKNIVHVGDSGAGQVAKACNQVVVSATLMGVAEALTFARRQDVDPAKVREALLGGFAYSRILEVHGQRMLERNFAPGFRARLHQKDMGIVLNEAQRLAMALPASAQAMQLINSLVGQGFGDEESSALIRIIEDLAGIGPSAEE